MDEYVTARDPVSTGGHVNLGLAYIYSGRLDEAVSSYRTALNLSPGYASAQVHIGAAQLLKGDHSAALEAVQRESSRPWPVRNHRQPVLRESAR
jgi:Flp pilus assembly protein TadD